MAVIGKNVVIYSGTSGTTPVIAGAKSCSISGSAGVIEKSSATQQTAKEFIAGRLEYDVSLDHLVTAGAPFEGLLLLGQTYTMRMVIGQASKQFTAICTEAELRGAVGALAAGSIRFKVSGPLT